MYSFGMAQVFYIKCMCLALRYRINNYCGHVISVYPGYLGKSHDIPPMQVIHSSWFVFPSLWQLLVSDWPKRAFALELICITTIKP
jgi:hypothetical protein